MLDTKLKKTHKPAIAIIAACILLPALILTALYPQMEKAALEKKTEYETAEDERGEELAAEETLMELDGSFDNMATEAAYYIYGTLLREMSGKYVDMSVLEEYGWINDYYHIRENTDFYAELSAVPNTGAGPEVIEEIVDEARAETTEEMTVIQETATEEPEDTEENKKYTMTNADWDMSVLLDKSQDTVMETLEETNPEMFGFLQMEFNAYGELADVKIGMRDDIYNAEDYYHSIMGSMEQYHTNAEWWTYNQDSTLNPEELVPKNMRVIFVMKNAEAFIHEYWEDVHYYSTDFQSLYLDTGAIIPVVLLAIFVALAALLLPFIRELETGWEKLFCIPFEVIVTLAFLGFLGACGMYMVMTESTMYNINQVTEYHGAFSLIGYELSNNFVYGALLFVNFLGWAVCFLAEYVVVASFRQFLCGPVYYIKERVLFIRFFRWIKRQCIRLYHYVTDIDITEKLNNSIVKIVLVNFLVLTLLCCMWFFGIAALVLYSIVLYIILRKYGEKLQSQYKGLLHATNQMAEGNLKIAIEEDLGVFKPLGAELEKVQQGFSKAVAEEAKSQNMKTELITNVSHDLKTPLTAIITYIELLKKDDINEEERESYIKTIDQKSQRLKVLIDDLFEVSKANSGNIQMNFMDVDVVNLMKQVRLEMEEKIADSDLSFRWNLPEEKLVLSLDGQKTYRVFENLLNNVLKYSLPYSRVYVDILDLKTHVQIIFRNISAVELSDAPEHLTDRFVRGDAARKTEGSGLGLAIVKSFVELQHGKLDISIDGDLFKVCITWQK